MKYKGFNILVHYCIAANWKLNKFDQVVNRIPKKEDIEYYEVFDPMENNDRWIAENTIAQCKGTIDQFLLSVGMKDNTQCSWDKLEKI